MPAVTVLSVYVVMLRPTVLISRKSASPPLVSLRSILKPTSLTELSVHVSVNWVAKALEAAAQIRNKRATGRNTVLRNNRPKLGRILTTGKLKGERRSGREGPVMKARLNR